MLPVWTIHDEWMFIRVLQAFEATFGLLAVHLRETVAAVRGGRLQRAATRTSAAAGLLRETAPLWSVIATLQPRAFHAFRAYTEGASAIQSRNYKLVESLCRSPEPSRRDSAAYLSVPDVRTLIIAGQTGIEEALDALGRDDDALSDSGLPGAMAEFSAALRQWRQTHYRLAVWMLGVDQLGTGYTQGVPYLAHARAEPVFRRHPPNGSPPGDDP
jgi:tryptophan 2,3-dioxygenase